MRSASRGNSLAFLAVIAIISGTGFYSIVEGLRIVDALYPPRTDLERRERRCA
jgi:hypothetical protein